MKTEIMSLLLPFLAFTTGLNIPVEPSSLLDIDQELLMGGIDPGSLLMRRTSKNLTDNNGPGLKEKINQMQSLYRQHKLQGLNSQDTTTLLLRISKFK